MSCSYAGRTRGAYLEAIAWILAWLGGRLEVLGAKLVVLTDVVTEVTDETGI